MNVLLTIQMRDYYLKSEVCKSNCAKGAQVIA